jgi:hypothetical protein
MAKITHQEMRGAKDVSTPTPQAQNYIVDDLSGAITPQALDERLAAFEGKKEEEMTQIEQSKEEVKKIDPQVETKKKLEKIIFMGRHSKTLELAGHKFDISTITHKENNEIMSRLMNIGEAADIFTIRVLTLSYAIRSIDGIAPANIEIEGQFDTALDHNVALIDNMQLGLVERLYNAFEALVKESDSIVYGEAIKN